MIWDLDIRRRFEHAAGHFQLDVQLTSDARRLVLFGASGAGKSQMLKAIAGLMTPDAGHVRLAGRALFDSAAGIDVPARRRKLGYVFQDYALFPHLNVAQNVAFGLSGRWRNPPREVADDAVTRWLRTFELQHLASHLPSQISGGQRQRTALARALAANPHALLLDEPFAALDPPLRARLRDELAELQVALNLPLLLITHDEADARRLGDEIRVIEQGRLETRRE